MPNETIAVVIPCFRVARSILDVIRTLPPWVDAVYCVDDACPEKSGQLVCAEIHDSRVRVLFHKQNQGVGGAVITGFKAALAAGHGIIVKVDGDGQVDPGLLPRLLHPVVSGAADFSKGNRFYDLQALRQMPLARRIGNFGLTLLTKAASGHWHISDPTNGFVAVHHVALQMLNFEELSRGYFFETSLLIQLNIVRAVVAEVPTPARYGAERSSLSVWRTLLGFPPKLVVGLLRRLFWRYFIYDINAVTVLLFVGSLSLAGGAAFGFYRWHEGIIAGRVQTTGTVALALLPVIVGIQMILQAWLLDIADKPAAPLSNRIRDKWGSNC
jgi:glycosyltransferase involved in cell wall biosynthesis